MVRNRVSFVLTLAMRDIVNDEATFKLSRNEGRFDWWVQTGDNRLRLRLRLGGGVVGS